MKKEKQRPYDLLLDKIERVESDCVHFYLCGGCKTQDLIYENELRLKEAYVFNLLKEAEISGFSYKGLVQNPLEFEYRNKMEYSFGDSEKDGCLALGMHKRGRHYEVQTALFCNLVDEDFRNILMKTLSFFRNSKDTFYHKRKREGALRHLVVRKGHFTGEILAMIVTTSAVESSLYDYAAALLSIKTIGKIVGILHIINDGVADTVAADSTTILHGRDFIIENLSGLQFKISPFAFFQTNSQGAIKLYESVREFAGFRKNKVIFDLYCGTGTISIFLASSAKIVYGIDISEESIAAARENVRLNDIINAFFVCGDVLHAVEFLEAEPDIIVIDPPRAGIHPKAIKKIINYNAPEIIYVSCNPKTFAQDAKIICESGYKLDKIRIHDMFSKTQNIEIVSLFVK